MSVCSSYQDYAASCRWYDNLPIRTMTAGDIMAAVAPGSGLTWTEELNDLWTRDRCDMLRLLQSVVDKGICRPVLIGPDGRLWDGHHRVAVALALNVTVRAWVILPS